jgi:molybdopterin-guanine dinucleotide biosynthesis protein A
MGTPKAALEWHGSTLLRRTVGIAARATGGPVVVVRASGQDLPELPGPVTVVDDPREGKGPVQGIAAGLAALAGQAEAAFVTSTDLPFLHPAFIRRVVGALRAPGGADGPDVALPVARGYPQPLAAAYRTGLAALAERLVTGGRLRPAFLFAECAVTRIDDAELLADPVLAALDPGLDSVLNVNTPADYARARRRPAPEVTVRLLGALVTPGRPAGPRPARAATVQAAADAVGLPLRGPVAVALNGDQVTRDPQAPLAQGDTVVFMPADRPAGLPAGLAAGPAPGRDRAVAGDKAGGLALGDPQAAAGAMDHPICPVVT